jgi:biopolymer transport protein ExbD
MPSSPAPSERRAPRRVRRRRTAIALTPLIDVVFILLVFFMLASSFADRRALPLTAAEAGGGGLEGALLLEVRSEGLRLSGEAIGAEALVARLAADPGRRVVVRAGRGASVQDAVAALDLLERAGVAGAALVP